jgi:hypothetical protein
VPIPIILLDGKTISSMGLITLQIHKIVRPVMEAIFEGGPRVYRAMLAIMAGAAPTAKNITQILTTVRPVMERI